MNFTNVGNILCVIMHNRTEMIAHLMIMNNYILCS